MSYIEKKSRFCFWYTLCMQLWCNFRTKTVYSATADAEKIKLLGGSEASAIEAVGNAEAERMRLKASAYKQYGDAAMLSLVLETLPKVCQICSVECALIPSFVCLVWLYLVFKVVVKFVSCLGKIWKFSKFLAKQTFLFCSWCLWLKVSRFFCFPCLSPSFSPLLF